MAGRCDILAGYGRAAFTREPAQSDPLWRVANNLHNILNARNAISVSDSSQAIKTTLARKSLGGFTTHFSPGASLRISPNHSRTGEYRVVSLLDSNLVLGRAIRLFKWPKCKTRSIHDMPNGRFDATKIPDGDSVDPVQPTTNQTTVTDNDARSSSDLPISEGAVPTVIETVEK